MPLITGISAGATGQGSSSFGPVLFGLAVLVAAAKAGGLLAERWRQPAVLGELVVGILLGNLLPALLGGEGLKFVRAIRSSRWPGWACRCSSPWSAWSCRWRWAGARRPGFCRRARCWCTSSSGRRCRPRAWGSRRACSRTSEPPRAARVTSSWGRRSWTLCFTLAFVAELVGLAAIIGAFAAGLLLDPYGRSARTEAEEATLRALLHPLSSLFVPLFFVMMGMQVHVGSLFEPSTVTLAAVLIVCALAGKLVCGFGVVSPGVNRIAVGIGMVPRGEVGLIFAGIGASLTIGDRPIFAQALFSAVVLMVLVTTLVAPVGLRWVLARGGGRPA